MKFIKCRNCGGSLDPGETCDCTEKNARAGRADSGQESIFNNYSTKKEKSQPLRGQEVHNIVAPLFKKWEEQKYVR